MAHGSIGLPWLFLYGTFVGVAAAVPGLLLVMIGELFGKPKQNPEQVSDYKDEPTLEEMMDAEKNKRR